VVSERGASILFSQQLSQTSNQPYFATKLFFSGDITSWTGKMAASMHGRFWHTTTAAITITGAYTQLLHTIQSPESLLQVGPGRRRIRLPSAFTKLLLVPGFHATCLASSAGSQATVNKLSHCVGGFGLKMSRSQGHWPQDPGNAFGPKQLFPTLSPGKCTRNGDFPTGCRHSLLTYIDW